MLLETIRAELHRLHAILPAAGLVTWTSGNISIRDRESGLVAIKPSGVHYQDLRPEHFVVLTDQGEVVEGDLKPSSDTASHLYIYRHRPDVFGVVHTHSAHATAFAANGLSIPVYLTAQADEFGCEIPCAGFGLIGSEAIGKLVVDSIGAAPACLLKNHGVFTIGKSGEAAVKTAVMVEDIARTVILARQLGTPDEIPADMVAKLHHRYTHEYGQ